MRWEKRESRELRDAPASAWLTGDLADMSCARNVLMVFGLHEYRIASVKQKGYYLTKERLYESKDSREIEKGSFSSTKLLDLFREGDRQ